MSDLTWAHVVNGRFPSRTAHSLQVVQMCEALGERGVQVSLVVPRRGGAADVPENVWSYYSVAESFGCDWLPVLDLLHPLASRQNPPLWLERPAFWGVAASFTLAATLWLRQHPKDVCYTRDPPVAWAAKKLSPKSARGVFLELHDRPGSPGLGRMAGRVLREVDGVVVTSRLLGIEAQRLGVPQGRVCLAPNGTRFEQSDFISRREARRQLRLPLSRTTIVYSGGLTQRGGVPTLLAAMEALPLEFLLVLVGGGLEEGREESVLTPRTSNVVYAGFVQHNLVPLYLSAADILVAPYSASDPGVAWGGSPLKVFEYLASGRPIVASDLPALREILTHGETAWLIQPDDPRALAAGIEYIAFHPDRARELSEKAQRQGLGLTWKARAERVAGFVSEILAGN